ncbi:hypothetical protein LJK88_08285 [Paenibacillus sp. P26]|nr:hypothetical protein LJK88_08285 [Paenibacillus sp. P26]
MIGFIGMSILFDPRLNDGSALTYVYLNAILNLSLTAIPFTLTMAVLRHRLWDIDPLVKRTLVYAALSVCVVAIYTFAVLYLSRLFETKDNFIISLVAAAVVAAAFAPLKDRLQRLINRFMKGRHDDPYAVLLELGDQLIQPLAPDDMLAAVTKTVKEALRLPYAGVSIHIGGQDTLAASAGEPVNDVCRFPSSTGGGARGAASIQPLAGRSVLHRGLQVSGGPPAPGRTDCGKCEHDAWHEAPR